MRRQVRSIFLRQMWLIFMLVALFLAGAVYLLMIEKGDLVLYLQQFHSSDNDQVVWFFNLLGDGWFLAAVALLLLFVNFRSFFVVAFSGIVVSVVVQFLKRVVFADEARPLRFFEDMGVALKEVEGISLSGNLAFPSGHTTTAFALFISLILLNKNKMVGLLFLLAAIAGGFARIYLGQHFYRDVYFGALIGTLIAFIVYFSLIQSSWYRKSWTKRSILSVFRRN